MGNKSDGIIHKFNVTRVDGTDAPGGKHDGCEYFVLDLTHDPLARPAIIAYALGAREAGYAKLAEDLMNKAQALHVKAAGGGMKPTPKPCSECGTQRPFCESLCGEAVFCQSCLTDAIAGDACRAANPNDGEIVAAQIPAMVEKLTRLAELLPACERYGQQDVHQLCIEAGHVLASAGIEWGET